MSYSNTKEYFSGGKNMEKKYVVVGEKDNSISKPMSREEAINKVKNLASEGAEYYIVSEAEGERIKQSGNFNKPKWE